MQSRCVYTGATRQVPDIQHPRHESGSSGMLVNIPQPTGWKKPKRPGL